MSAIERQNTLQTKMAFTLVEAAEVSSLKEADIVRAVRDGQLVARIMGQKALIVATDLQAWLITLPMWESETRTVKAAA